jgi:hypothetical protein
MLHCSFCRAPLHHPQSPLASVTIYNKTIYPRHVHPLFSLFLRHNKIYQALSEMKQERKILSFYMQNTTRHVWYPCSQDFNFRFSPKRDATSTGESPHTDTDTHLCNITRFVRTTKRRTRRRRIWGTVEMENLIEISIYMHTLVFCV